MVRWFVSALTGISKGSIASWHGLRMTYPFSDLILEILLLSLCWSGDVRKITQFILYILIFLYWGKVGKLLLYFKISLILRRKIQKFQSINKKRQSV
jgi:hypothetical protein